mmetsp:Transcript_26886/g.88227  ORF Transcript_26886/g.88227 Transcript_26886/m.88227 type:complete len:265 (-) Transcript_26886:2409-3203(-)
MRRIGGCHRRIDNMTARNQALVHHESITKELTPAVQHPDAPRRDLQARSHLCTQLLHVFVAVKLDAQRLRLLLLLLLLLLPRRDGDIYVHRRAGERRTVRRKLCHSRALKVSSDAKLVQEAKRAFRSALELCDNLGVFERRILLKRRSSVAETPHAASKQAFTDLRFFRPKIFGKVLEEAEHQRLNLIEDVVGLRREIELPDVIHSHDVQIVHAHPQVIFLRELNLELLLANLHQECTKTLPAGVRERRRIEPDEIVEKADASL